MYDDSETTYETPIFPCLNITIHIYLCLMVNETKNPQHLDCGRLVPEIKRFQTRLESNRSIPYLLQISIYHIN